MGPEESLSEKAKVVRAGRYDLLAPDLLWAELASILWKQHRRRELERDVAEAMLDELQAAPIEISAHERLLPAALRLAMDLGCTPYDCLYVALALEAHAPLVTDDRRLHRVIAASSLAGASVPVEDVP